MKKYNASKSPPVLTSASAASGEDKSDDHCLKIKFCPHLDYQVFPQENEKLFASSPTHPQILSESTNSSQNSALNVSVHLLTAGNLI